VCLVLFLVYTSWFSDHFNCLPLTIVFHWVSTSRQQHSLTINTPDTDAAMQFPSLLFAAVAGLWQQPLISKHETSTSPRHIHGTRTVTNFSSTIYAVRVGTSTLYMEYLPATLITESAPWQALQTPHLELRAEEPSTMHIKITQTVAQIEATVFASRVGTSVSTITNAPQSLVEEHSW
jgi:DNA-binding transcriptional regulator YiaG